ncbi:unnamed protein product [Cladocopium goreaui]|uniref:O-phosphoseryl-tRNA(Sec) selenium transferase n=1 Tax=Cladocopium goreaui TaxID=2562237 RepID=A0A9P1BUB5_9DINO|nr:unnamed protein product [Cladocopium goreaui]
MLPQHFDLLKGLVNPNYVEQGAQARNSRSKHFTALFTQRRLPDVGWKEDDIKSLLDEMASFDTNNFEGNVGVGEREGRVICDMVRRRHFGLTHGIGRSGDVMAEQPKAAGSSLLVQLTRYLALDAIRLSGIKAAKACAVLPAATGLTMTLVFLALRQMRPQGKYVVWSRIDQKSCFKAIGAAGLKAIVVELKPIEGTDALGTDIAGMQSAIEKVGAEEVLCICTTTSTFAPRVPDFIDEVAVLAKDLNVPHVINNAYGLQCSKCTHLVETGCRRGRVDAFVQSTDKNFMVPVGGAIVAGPSSALVDKVSSLYPGRASMSPVLDLFITLLSLGASGWTGLLQERKENAKWFEERLSSVSEKLGLRVLKALARITCASDGGSLQWLGAANFKATLPSKADDTLTTRAKERQRKASCPCLAVNGDERISVLGCNDFETVPAKASLRRVACVCQSGMGLHWDLLRQTASQAGVYHSLVITKILVRASQSCTPWAYDIAMYRACMDRMDTSCCRRLRPTSPLEQYQAAQEHLVETLAVLPFAEECLQPQAQPRWPISTFDVHSNYVRFYRAISYYFQTAELIEDLLWQPSRTCMDDADCQGMLDHVCSMRLHRCVHMQEGCPKNAEVCPPAERCTSVKSFSDSCALEISPVCINNGEIQAFHPNKACLAGLEVPTMIKACSEMGTTLYPLQWCSTSYHQTFRDFGGAAAAEEAFILPVTLRLRSPWHMLHSLVPAFAQARMDESYGFNPGGDFDLLIVDQDLDKDRHIWGKVFGAEASNKSMGGLDFLLQLISNRPYKMLAEVQGACYERAIWGHELMLYSGGGWANETHMTGFVNAARRMVQALPVQEEVAGIPRLLLVERRNSSAWGRWIDNFADVHATAEEWVAEHPALVSGVEVADLAELTWSNQLRLAVRMRLLFGAHGDGLSWAVFMGAGSALLEAVPAREAGFQARWKA